MTLDVLANRCYKSRFFVIDVLEVDVLGARRNFPVFFQSNYNINNTMKWKAFLFHILLFATITNVVYCNNNNNEPSNNSNNNNNNNEPSNNSNNNNEPSNNNSNPPLSFQKKCNSNELLIAKPSSVYFLGGEEVELSVPCFDVSSELVTCYSSFSLGKLRLGLVILGYVN